MHRVLIPVDFSETALNAARFTAHMLAGKKDAIAILYHLYEQDDDYDIVKSFMETLKHDLLQKGDAAVEYVIEKGGNLVDNLAQIAQAREVTLIAMGITGKSALQQVLIGSNTLKMVDRKICPVMIIPTSAVYSPIRNVAFASDFKEVEKSTPAKLINAVLAMFDPKLHIVHVSTEENSDPIENKEATQEIFASMFNNYSPDFHFIKLNDFQLAIDNFIKDAQIDVLLTIPRHQSNDNNLLKASHTRRLAYHSHIPILAAHQ